MHRTNRPGPKQVRRQLSAPRNKLPLDTPTEIRAISNRHTPELEIELSDRKQRIGPLSNRHKFAFCERVSFTLSGVEGSPLSASSASYSSSAPGSSCPNPKLLDYSLTHRKHNTSQFLIDNFGVYLSQASSLLSSSAPSPSFSSASFASFASSASASHGSLPLCLPASGTSNRPQIAVFNSAASRRSARLCPTSNVKPPTSRILIANETHSRAESSLCKQSTYEILIANEFHSLISPHERFFYPEAESVLTPERRVADSVRGASTQR